MQIKPDEITSILKSRIEGLEAGQADLTEVGTVLSVADGIARVHGLDKAISGADETVLNFLRLLIDKHRMPVLFRVRAEYDRLWEEENKLLPVTVTSAVELPEETVKQIGDRIAEQTDRKVDLQSKVDPDILGGIVVRVGNSVLDASIRNRLENFRKQVARAS